VDYTVGVGFHNPKISKTPFTTHNYAYCAFTFISDQRNTDLYSPSCREEFFSETQ
jgi:hypothetical protein